MTLRACLTLLALSSLLAIGGCADRAALERHFGEHRRARCAGEILRAPCPPGVHVWVQIPAPPVGTVMRQP